MNRTVKSMLAFGLLVAFVRSGWAAEPNLEQAKAIAEIEKLGGKVLFDEHSPGKRVIREVDLLGTKVTDADLKRLEGFKQLQLLNLWTFAGFRWSKWPVGGSI